LRDYGHGFGGHTFTCTKKLTESSFEGPKFGQAGWQNEIICDLSKIRYEVPKYTEKNGVKKPVSPEDAFMLAGVQSAVHSKMISNDYFLCIELAYDGCTCCADLPDSRMPITIVPIVDPKCFGFTSPDGWAPTDLGGFNFQLQYYQY
jgi:hypothetical protein